MKNQIHRQNIFNARVVSNSHIPTVAIVGAGFSGSLIATHLLRNSSQPLKIKLIDRNSEFAKGVAYSSKENTDLLNVPVGKMSAFPDDSDNLLRWLESNSHSLQDLLPTPVSHRTFIPRQVYGLYIQSILEEAQNNGKNNVDLERLNHEVIAIEKINQEFLISLDNDTNFQADKVILAIGNSPSNPAQDNHNNFYNAWSGSALDNINPHADILLMGTGLTMADIVASLHSRNHLGKIYAVSRRGLSPQIHKTTSSHPPLFTLENLPLNILKLSKLIRSEIRKAQGLGYDWRSIIDSLRPITQQLWQKLPKTEQKRFLRHLVSYWDVHRHRIAPNIGEIIRAKLKSGQLTISAGRIKDYQLERDKTKVIIRPRYQSEDTVILVDRVIHCRGINNYHSLSHPLINNLQVQGLIRLNKLGLGIDTDAQGRIIDAQGQISRLLYTIGTPRRGDLWETTAIPELRRQAQTLAENIIADLEIPKVELITTPSLRQILSKIA
ncbi:FAD/NAD(P)-binding protein [Geminocystis sp. GBBB08]|uniref:FAD/NAD(P)-binding protein n=1 Tax=Geminocystis sp. GBBB08 TaxID=2604140 RepID=UPI0027E2ACC9|nr:FAD/NAD(P)-binding protein [Geminocystis sp. GBBB08]MBL1208949.1 NADPH-dependent L-lysine N(6)-monooxygenase [Geminocystis sp. GBBB08]